MTKGEAPAYGSWDFTRERIKELMPRNYSDKIKKQIDHRAAIGLGFLTPAESGTLAVHAVLEDRLLELDRQYDLSEPRLESAAKVNWTEKQLKRVETNRHYRSAQRKLNSGPSLHAGPLFHLRDTG